MFLIEAQSFTKAVDEKANTTERNVLRVVSIGGFVKKLIFFQESYSRGYKLDTILDDNLQLKWSLIVKEFSKAKDRLIPRIHCADKINEQTETKEFVGFSEASEYAHECVI